MKPSIRLHCIYMAAVALVVIACQPPERDYGTMRDVAPAKPHIAREEPKTSNQKSITKSPVALEMEDFVSPPMLPPPWPQPEVWEMPELLPPPVGGGSGVPTCYDVPILTTGYAACMPTLGSDGLNSVQLRVAGGELIQFIIGGRQSLFLEDQPEGVPNAEFAGITSALAHREARARLTKKNFVFAVWTPTVLIDSTSTIVRGYLPEAGVQPGIRFTAKMAKGTKAAIYPNGSETIEGQAIYKLEGTGAFATFVSGDTDGDTYADTWFIVGRSYP